jgi:hypothetical protein
MNHDRGCTVYHGLAVGADTGSPGHISTLTGARLSAALGNGSSLVGVEKREGSVGIQLRTSPKLERWCGGWATVVKRRCGGRATVVKQAAGKELGSGSAQAWREGEKGAGRTGWGGSLL